MKSIVKIKLYSWVLATMLLCVMHLIVVAREVPLRFIPFEANDDLPSKNITSISQDSSGYIWISTIGGLCRYDGTRIRYFIPKPNPFGCSEYSWYNRIVFTRTDAYISAMFKVLRVDMRTSSLSQANVSNTIARCFTHTRKQSDEWDHTTTHLVHIPTGKHIPLPRKNVAIYSLCKTSTGDVWLATEHGAWRYSKERQVFTVYQNDDSLPNSLPTNSIREIMEDANGTLWFGTYGMGVYCLQIQRSGLFEVVLPHRSNGKARGEFVMGIDEDANGNIWSVSTNNGISVYERSKRRQTSFIPVVQNIAEPDLRMIQITDSVLWTGGTALLRVNRKTQFAERLDVPAHKVVFADSRGRLWCANEHEKRGLYVIDGTTRQTLMRFDKSDSTRQSLLHPITNVLFEDKHERIWIGSNSGVSFYDESVQQITHVWRRPRQIEQLSGTKVLDAYQVNSISQDSYGTMWFGSRGGGLMKYNGKTVQPIISLRKYGMYIYSMVADSAGYLWLGMENCLIKFNTRSETIADIYTTDDGLPANEFNINATCTLQSGEIAMGGIYGYVIFNPYLLRKENVSVTPMIDDVHVFDKPADTDTSIQYISSLDLKHTENYLTFFYSIPVYLRRSQYRIQYRLAGLEEQWTADDGTMHARYTNLDYGSYTFEVQCIQPDGTTTTSRSLPLVIHRPYYRTWWFYTLVMLITFILIYLVVSLVFKVRKSRYEKEVELQRQRNRISGDLHDELGATLTKISLLSELALRNVTDGSATNHIKTISSSAREAVRSIGSIVWELDSDHDTIAGTLGYIHDKTTELLEETSIAFNFRLEGQQNDISVPSLVRRNLYLIVREAVHNVIKHSRATHVEIEARIIDDVLIITINDNGTGIAEDRINSYGNGLKNMNDRTAVIGGEFRISSNSDSTGGRKTGTTISISIPLSFATEIGSQQNTQ